MKKMLWVWILGLKLLNRQNSVYSEPQVPCFFIFGDSLSDSGNNNPLSTDAKANYPPYGIDFPYGPTGRFCNGRTVVDFLGELLGFEGFIPSFVMSASADILKGVNYASGSAGIRGETGHHMGSCFSMNRQIMNHQTTIRRLVREFGDAEAASDHLKKCLYYLEIGNNDYINNYFLPQYYSTSHHFTPEQYALVLIDQYSHQLKRLYSLGARKFAIEGVGDIGCTPNAIATYSMNGSCVDKMNNAAYLFSEKLKVLIDQLNKDLVDAKFTYVSSGNSTTGFKVSDTGCCQVSSKGACIAFQKPCQNRDEYVFWDSFHPTEAFNKIAASRIYKTLNLSSAYQFNIHHYHPLANRYADM